MSSIGNSVPHVPLAIVPNNISSAARDPYFLKHPEQSERALFLVPHVPLASELT